MALLSTGPHPIEGLLGQRLSAKGDALIDAYIIAYAGGFADDHSGAVIDEEVFANGGPGMDVDAGAAVGPLRHDPGNQGNLGLVKLVGQPIGGDGLDARIAQDDFVETLGRGVAGKGSSNVAFELAANPGDGPEDLDGGLLGPSQAEVCGAIGFVALVAEALLDLLGEVLEDLVKKRADHMVEATATKGVAAHEAGKEYVEELIEALKDDVFAGQVSAVDVVNAALVHIGGQGPADDAGQDFACGFVLSFSSSSCFGHW